MTKKYSYVKKRYVFLFGVIDFIGAVAFGIVGLFKRRKQNFEIKKIIVFELAHIGDVLAITPAMNLLRKKFPQASISVVVSPWAKDIITGNPDINDIIVYRPSWFDRTDKSPFSLTETISFIKILRSEHFDLGIDMRGDFRTILLMWLGSVKRRLGYGFAGGKFLLTDVRPFDVERRQDRHQVDHNLDLIDSIGQGRKCNDRTRVFKIFFSYEDSMYIDNFLKESGVIDDDFLIALHPGSGLPTKRWPIERYSFLINRMLKTYNVKIILIGGQEEKGLAIKLKSLSGAELIDAVGRTNIKQLAALLRRCNLFVGGDSGVMQIASAVKTPIVTVWGGHNKPSHWRPLSETDIVIHKRVDCSPCGLIRCKDLKCLRLITVDDVLDGINESIRSLKYA